MKYTIPVDLSKNKINSIHKYIGIFSAMLIILYLIAGLYIMAAGCLTNRTLPVFKQGIADGLIRFHVKGHSGSIEDQAVKLLVKDEIIDYLKPYLISVSSKNQAAEVIQYHMDGIIKTAQNKLRESGFSYSVTASLAPAYFPIKVYGDISLPAGTYDALIVSLGRAEGQNWWCIMFPQLCFIDSSYSTVPDSSKSELKHLLTEEEYAAILNSPVEVSYKFKIVEWLKNIF